MRRILTLSLVTVPLMLASCKSGKPLLPNISGKAGEIVVVIDKANLEGELGSSLREVLGGDCPYLYQPEPLFTLAYVTPPGFIDMFKVHRNILITHIDESVENEGIVYRNNVWAAPQCVMQLNARTAGNAIEILNENSERLISAFEQAERDRIIMNSKQYEDYSVSAKVKALFGGSPHFPTGYRLKKTTDDFAWISDDKQYSIQGVFVYKYPAAENENFTKENIVAHRNAFLKKYVPGMFDNTWMTTGTYVEPTVEFIRFKGRQFAQTRGYWEIQNDFMGGPFVSHSFYSRDGKDIIVIDGFVYAPKYDKRPYLRTVESIMYSFDWDDNAVAGTTSTEDGETVVEDTKVSR